MPANKNQLEKVSFIKKVFSPQYIKKDFRHWLEIKREDSFIFWGLAVYIILNFVALWAIFSYYVIAAILQL